MSLSLAERAVAVLTTADGWEKTALSHAHAAAWFASRAAGEPLALGRAEPPLRPARPDRPELLPPRDVPRRRPGSPQGRIAAFERHHKCRTTFDGLRYQPCFARSL